jgi:uncharacterized GH25 family protein
MTLAHRPLQLLLALLLALAARSAVAHEFWMMPSAFHAQPASTASFSLFVGENFQGEQVGIHTNLVSMLRQSTLTSQNDLRARVPVTAVGTLPITFTHAGTTLIALDTHPTTIELPPEKFNDYLKQEGLEHVMRLRNQAGTAGAPGRERYRRSIKSLILVGSAPDATFARRTGQRLEIVPLTDPYRLRPGGPISLEVHFEGRPLANALVKFWNRRANGLIVLEQRTDAQGRANFLADRPGIWMASVVHMIPAPDKAEADWDSFWGNLTFAVGRTLR